MRSATVFTSSDNAANNGDLVRRFLAAFSKGAADFNAALVDKTTSAEEEEAMVRLIHKYVNADRPFEKAAPSIRNGSMRINEGARLKLSSVEDQLDWFQASGLISESITIDMLVDTSYVEVF